MKEGKGKEGDVEAQGGRMRPCYSQWVGREVLCKLEQGTRGRERAGWPSESTNLTGSPLHGLFGWSDRVGRQVRLSNSKEGWLPWSVGPMTLNL